MNVCNIGTNQFLIEEIWHQSEGYDFCNSKLGKLLKAQSLGVLTVAIHDTDIYIYIVDDNRFESIENDNDSDTKNDSKTGDRGDDNDSSRGY